MDTTTAKAMFAAESVQQRQRTLDELQGKGWRRMNFADLMMIVSLVTLIWAGYIGDYKFASSAAAMAIVFSYTAGDIRLNRRTQALLRLLESTPASE